LANDSKADQRAVEQYFVVFVWPCF